MASRPFPILILCGLLLAAVPLEAGVLEGNCRVADQPAATLLIPYFEVDLADPSGQTTLFSVNNASVKPALARVVLWTDWGVPTLAFDVYLTGYDVQTFNVRDLLQGRLPASGPEASNVGSLSSNSVIFSGCGNTGTAGVAAPLEAAQITWLQAAHAGRPVAASPTEQCAGSGAAGTNLATGYITVDAVNRCTSRSVGTADNTPAGAGYFAKGGSGIASDANVLWGDYHYVDAHKMRADSQTAVSIVADPDIFAGGDYTFYGRYVSFDGRDDRAPLSSLYYARYMDGGPFSGGTDLVVWRDNRTASTVLGSCGAKPSWAPLGEMQLVIFDEEENPKEIVGGNSFPLATQKVHVGSAALAVPEPFGFLMIDLWHKDSTHAQGWVSITMSAEGRFSTGHEAVRVDDLCNFGI
ncbi:MAG TPA: hypothetical protein VGX68_29585 [Thermoanaerobaculia bacterium]|jgi:hypothetical protein|nr:hypothetical protein [Thermoanaerobaculia bacterium]